MITGGGFPSRGRKSHKPAWSLLDLAAKLGVDYKSLKALVNSSKQGPTPAMQGQINKARTCYALYEPEAFMKWWEGVKNVKTGGS